MSSFTLPLCSSNDLSFISWILSQHTHRQIHTHAHTPTHNTQLHKQSSTLKRIPMRHVTGSLCPAVCLLERYQLLQFCFSALLWGRRRRRRRPTLFVCAPYLIHTCMHGCLFRCQQGAHSGIGTVISDNKVCLCFRCQLKMKPLLKENTQPLCMNKSPPAYSRGQCLCVTPATLL